MPVWFRFVEWTLEIRSDDFRRSCVTMFNTHQSPTWWKQDSFREHCCLATGSQQGKERSRWGCPFLHPLKSSDPPSQVPTMARHQNYQTVPTLFLWTSLKRRIPAHDQVEWRFPLQSAQKQPILPFWESTTIALGISLTGLQAPWAWGLLTRDHICWIS